MSSLAQIMASRGFQVSGSDMQESHALETLRQKNIRCFIGHAAENVAEESPDIIVKTDAIADTNPEILYAAEKGIPVVRRAELLGWILDGYGKTVGVAGTHGKTTTTSMVTSIFLETSGLK